MLHVIHRIKSDYFLQQQQWASVCNGTHFFLCEVGKEMKYGVNILILSDGI